MADSNIVAALDAVAAIQSAVTVTFNDSTVGQVTHAYPYGEWSITSVNCPFFVNQTNGGDCNIGATQGRQDIDNVVEMFLCLWPTSQGRSREQTMRYVLEWRDAVFTAFALKIRLGGAMSFVKQAFISHWDFGAYTLGATEYHAIRFTLKLDEAFVLPVGE